MPRFNKFCSLKKSLFSYVKLSVHIGVISYFYYSKNYFNKSNEVKGLGEAITFLLQITMFAQVVK